MRVLRLQKPDQQYVVVELLHRALRGPSGLLATQRRACAVRRTPAGRAY